MSYWRAGRVVKSTRSFFGEFWPPKSPWTMNIHDIRCTINCRRIGTGSSSSDGSWTDKIRDAVISLLPPDQQVDFKVRIEHDKIRKEISSRFQVVDGKTDSLNKDFNKIVENLPGPFQTKGTPLSAVLESLMEYYPSLKGSLPENTAVLLSISLYHDQKYIQSARTLLDNLYLGDSFFTGFCNKLVPELASIHGYEFVLGNMIRAFVSLDQTNTVSQLLLELGETQKQVSDRINLSKILLELEQSCFTEQSSEEFINSAIDGFRIPQLFAYKKLSIDIRLRIFCHFTRIDSRFLELVFSKKNFKENFLSQPFVLHNFILEMKRHNWWNSTNLTKFLHLFDQWYFEYSPSDLRALASIPCEGREFSRIFRIYNKYHKKRCTSLTANQNDEILDTFLRYAIKHHQTVTVTDVVKAGACNDPVLVSEAIDTVTWGKIKKDVDDNALHVEKASDASLLYRVFSAVPISILEKSLVISMNKLARRGPPGKILWDFLSAVTNFSGIQSLPPQFERTAAIAISSRPHFEQMRYMALDKISPAGIVANLNQFIARVRLSQTESDAFDSDLKLILMSLILLNEKIHGSVQASHEPVEVDRMANAITNLFHQWNERKAVEVMRFLAQKQIEIPEKAVIRSTAILVKSKQFNLATQLLNSVPAIEPSSFYAFLIIASRTWPILCKNLMEWLRVARQLIIPSGVIRKVIAGYSQSPVLTAAQCNNRIIPLIGILRFRKQNVGVKTSIAIVEGILRRAECSNNGSKKRLIWAIDLARDENVSKEEINRWMRRVRSMRIGRHGFWKKKDV